MPQLDPAAIPKELLDIIHVVVVLKDNLVSEAQITSIFGEYNGVLGQLEPLVKAIRVMQAMIPMPPLAEIIPKLELLRDAPTSDPLLR
jgi:hypothetical protein